MLDFLIRAAKGECRQDDEILSIVLFGASCWFLAVAGWFMVLGVFALAAWKFFDLGHYLGAW